MANKYSFSNNTYLTTPKDNPKDLVQVIIGDDKEPDIILPQAKIQRWDNECNVSIRLKDFDNYGVIQEQDKVIFGNETKEVHFYQIPEGDGANEIEVVLKEKPLTNVIHFSLIDKDVEYFYQPTLREKLGQFAVEKREIDRIIKNQQFSSLVDIGGGTGWFAKKFNGTCIDYSDEAYSKRVTDNYIKSNIKNGVAVIDKQFDIAVGIGFLRYFQNEDSIREAIQEIARISKKGIFFDGQGFEFFEDTLPPDRCSTDWDKSKRSYWLEKFALYAPDYPIEIYDISYSITPENVEGSYAVYAKSNKVNYVDGKEYKVGKVGHIYRPKIIDSIGTEVWGKLHIDNGILSVIIPQEFLDSAIYPVRHAAGLTFGYTSGGTQTLRISASANNQFDDATGAAGTGNSMSAYIYPTTTNFNF